MKKILLFALLVSPIMGMKLGKKKERAKDPIDMHNVLKVLFTVRAELREELRRLETDWIIMKADEEDQKERAESKRKLAELQERYNQRNDQISQVLEMQNPAKPGKLMKVIRSELAQLVAMSKERDRLHHQGNCNSSEWLRLFEVWRAKKEDRCNAEIKMLEKHFDALVEKVAK